MRFEALVIQSEARIRACAYPGAEKPAEQHALARLVASTIRENAQRGRIPPSPALNPQTGVPDGYVDRVLSFLRTEEPTLRALREGEDDAWGQLLDLLCARAYTYLRRRGLRTAEAWGLAQDVAQSCAVTLWEGALERFPYDTPFSAWVSRVVEYEVSGWGRSSRKRRALSLDGPPDSHGEGSLYEVFPDRRASQAMDAAEARLTLDDTLRKLPSEAQRQTVTRQLAGQSDAEIAHALGRSKGAVYSLRHRALRASRAILEGRSGAPSHRH